MDNPEVLEDNTSLSIMDNVLSSIKKLIGYSVEVVCFDADILMHINSCVPSLREFGVLPLVADLVIDEETKWSDILEKNNIGLIREYVYLSVKVIFDPPISSFVLESMNRQIQKDEWRITSIYDRK